MYVLAHRTSPCRGTRAKSRDKPAQASSTGVVPLDNGIVPCLAARVEYVIQRSFAFVNRGLLPKPSSKLQVRLDAEAEEQGTRSLCEKVGCVFKNEASEADSLQPPTRSSWQASEGEKQVPRQMASTGLQLDQGRNKPTFTVNSAARLGCNIIAGTIFDIGVS